MPLPMPSVAPLYLESDTYTSTLYLINRLTVGVETDVMIYDMTGALLTTKHLYVDPNTQQAISVRKALSDGGFFSQAGSVEVLTPTHAAAVLGQLSITRTGTSKGYLDEEFIMPESGSSQTLRAVIDSPGNSPIVAITNISNTISQVLHTRCIQATGGTVEKSLTLHPNETRLVRACSTIADAVFSADEIDAQFVLKPEDPSSLSGQNVAGISITTDGPPGKLAAFGFVAHEDNFGSYFSAMNFYDPGLLRSSGYVFTGVPVGTSSLLPGTAYMPQVAVANFSAVPQTVNVLFATGTGVDLHQVTSVSVPAGTSLLLGLPNTTGDPSWQNSFVVRSSGQPGDVIAKMMFKSTGRLPNIELIGKDESDVHTAGDHPWSTDGGIRSTLFLFNHSPNVKSVTVRIGTANAIWLKVFALQPNENKAISIGDVVSSGTPDMEGRMLPKNATSGEVGWWAPAKGGAEVTGRLVQIDASGSVARNFSCGDVIMLCDIEFIDSVIDLAPNDPASVEDSISYYCSVDPGTAEGGGCPVGDPTYTSTEQSSYYSSTNPDIASVSGSGEYSNWTGMSIGSALGTIGACTVGGDNCCSGNSPVNTNPTVTITSNINNNTITAGAVDSAGTALNYTLTANGTPSGGSYSWTISGTGATISNASSATVSVSGTASGTPTLSVTYTLSGETSKPATKQITVLKADNMFVAEDTQGSAACPGNAPNSNLRIITYTIRSGSTQISDAINMTEGVPNPLKDSCGNTIATGAGGFNTANVSPNNKYQINDLQQECQASCTTTIPNQQWIQTNVGTIATIGQVTTTSTTITVDGNSNSLQGADFNASGKQ